MEAKQNVWHVFGEVHRRSQGRSQGHSLQLDDNIFMQIRN